MEKKVLEVLQCSDGELKFNSEIDVDSDPTVVMDIMSSAMFCMATKLWGEKENSVVAMIRALFVADMAISVDRDFILKGLSKEAAHMGRLFNDMMEKFQAEGRVTGLVSGRPNPNKKNMS